MAIHAVTHALNLVTCQCLIKKKNPPSRSLMKKTARTGMELGMEMQSSVLT